MSTDSQRASVIRHLNQAAELVADGRLLGMESEGSSIEAAAMRYRDAWQTVEGAEADLLVFAARNHGITYRSKDREERELIGRVATARREALTAFHELERVGAPVAAAVRRAVATPAPADGAGRAERPSLPGASPGRGPRPLVDPDDVDRARAELASEGAPAGERSIAKRLGVGRDAVRYAQGKDRRRP